MMKKIVFCLNNLDYGGIETASLNLTNKLDYQKYEVTVILEINVLKLLIIMFQTVKILLKEK